MDKMNKEQTTDKIRKFLEEHDLSAGELSCILKDINRSEHDVKIKEQVAKNKDLEGRYFCRVTHPKRNMFPEMKEFYKVVSARSDNEYRVECLTFTEHPLYWFEYKAHLIGYAGDYYLGGFDFGSFEVESLLADQIRDMEEITEEEFSEHARSYLEELLSLEWHSDHCRYGGKLPSDPDWPKK